MTNRVSSPKRKALAPTGPKTRPDRPITRRGSQSAPKAKSGHASASPPRPARTGDPMARQEMYLVQIQFRDARKAAAFMALSVAERGQIICRALAKSTTRR